MNPELQRNLWLETSPVRIIMMPLVLGLLFVATWTTTDLAGDWATQLAAIDYLARVLFFLIVVVWGTWIAARLVTGEIRGRTWDTQRMSAISPLSMVMGKLIGGTAFVWYGGLICLAVIVFNALSTGGPVDAFESLFFWIATGLFAHLTALFVSMVAVRRGAATSRLMSFFALILGIMAGWSVLQAWMAAQGEIFGLSLETADLAVFWFGYEVRATTFQLYNLGFSVIWTFLGCYVLMRHELQTRTGPWIWIGYIAYTMIFAAGYADVYAHMGDTLAGHIPVDASGKGVVEAESIFGFISNEILIAMRCAMAGIAVLVLTYASLLLAPKDWVQMRWVRGRLLHGRIDQVLMNLPAWGYALIGTAVAVAGIFLTVDPIALPTAELAQIEGTDFGNLPAVIDGRIIAVTIFCFLLRDIGIVLWFNAGKNARRPDLGALVTLILLYMIVPMILFGTQQTWLTPAFSLSFQDHGWTQPLWPLAETAVVFVLVVLRRSGVRERQT